MLMRKKIRMPVFIMLWLQGITVNLHFILTGKLHRYVHVYVVIDIFCI